MCVIMIVPEDSVRPSTKMIDDAYNKNGDGGGIAWREQNGKGENIVHWKKGLSRPEMHEMMGWAPTPYVAHFRLKSIGEAKPNMCHPFTVDLKADIALEGTTKSHVFFHNGTWGKWDEFLLKVAIETGKKIPPGKWTDTRAMAWLSSILGPGLLDIIEAKAVSFGPNPNEMEVFAGTTGWEKFNGVWVSNTHFNTPSWQRNHGVGSNYFDSHVDDRLPVVHRPHGGGPTVGANFSKVERIYCVYPHCTKRDVLDDDGYCPEHSSKKKELSIVKVPSPQTTPQSTPSGGSSTESGKGKISPCEAVVKEAREVASTLGPFQAIAFIESRVTLDKDDPRKLSHSQYKKLKADFNRMLELDKRNQRVNRQVLPAD